ncbi:MAG TPA: EthD family reductase [Chitinophagaceae bacterium]|nr:EthD family reductase [Chitinophagaceae bacterium]
MRTKICLLVITVGLALGCQQTKLTSNVTNKKGMIKVTVLYPNAEGKTFDMDYYKAKHIPLVQHLFGDAMKGAAIDKGIAGGAPDTPVPYLAIGYLYFESISAYQDGLKNNLEEILADIPKYTNITPVIQISEAVQ